MKEKLRLVIAAPLMASLLVLSLVSFAAPVASQVAEIPRNEIVWASGYWQRPGSWVPCVASWGQAWGTYIMYETLFQWNYWTNKLEGILAEKIEWINDTVIEVTLRNGIHWNDGTPITTHDVNYSYYLFGGFDESPNDGQYWQIPGFRERVGPMSNFEIVNDRVFRVHIKPEYPHSRTVYYTLTGGAVLIVPRRVWEEIEKQYPFVPDFPNDWTSQDFPDEWKVASGPYLPYYWTVDKDIYKRNENWWGNATFGKPVPKYIGSLYFESNYGTNTALDQGRIDWYGGYYPRIWEIPNPYIDVWTHMKPPYFLCQPSSFALVFNYNNYPLCESWLHRALAFAINYKDLSETCASGYLIKPNPTLLCPYYEQQAKLIDNETVATYDFYFNPDKANSTLAEHCYKVGDAWYTKDAPETWRNQTIVDELPDTPGRNVKLGPWKIMNVYGWTDTMLEALAMSQSIYDILKIVVESDPIEYNTFVTKFQSMDFDMQIQTNVGGTTPWPHSFYVPAITGQPGQWQNYPGYGNWPTFTGSEVDNLTAEADIVVEGSAREAQIYKRLQEIYASELPAIPFAYSPKWYAFQTKYWTNWPSEDNPYEFPTAPWDIGDPGMMEKLIISLKAATPDFVIRVNPTSGLVLQKDSVTATVSINPVGGFAETVNLSAYGLPSGATTSFSPSSGTPALTSTLRISTSENTPTGNQTITITATGGGKTHNATYTLTVTTVVAPTPPWIWIGVAIGAVIVIAVAVLALTRRKK